MILKGMKLIADAREVVWSVCVSVVAMAALPAEDSFLAEKGLVPCPPATGTHLLPSVE